MRHAISVNAFEVEFHDGGYPLWVEIKHDGKSICRIHHREVKDLEYCLTRIRTELRSQLGDHPTEKDEA